jgi:hypothetical protein
MEQEIVSDTSAKDFRVQGAWLNKDATGTDPTSKGYELLVRVYRADSFATDVEKLKAPKNATKQSVVGSGLGDRTMPVVEMTTQIPPTQEIVCISILCARQKTRTTVNNNQSPRY